jgi:hypothetical protein
MIDGDDDWMAANSAWAAGTIRAYSLVTAHFRSLIKAGSCEEDAKREQCQWVGFRYQGRQPACCWRFVTGNSLTACAGNLLTYVQKTACVCVCVWFRAGHAACESPQPCHRGRNGKKTWREYYERATRSRQKWFMRCGGPLRYTQSHKHQSTYLHNREQELGTNDSTSSASVPPNFSVTAVIISH